ncbi:MAG: M28 family peptidase [Gemmatimonas sp.]|jgi:hypothetical protein|uniref:M28 family peptidase n=1 Tax=Gemmatimonas sp. TaxID=1962908 RepID=UPI00391F3945|nr:M20/M25/M40 family metallo-hydrolase [Gemmatimonadota bacterium]
MTQSFALALSALLLAVPSHPRASLRAPRAARTSAVAERVQPLDTARLRTHLQALTAPAMEGRGAGYPGDLRAAHYISRQFRAAGLRPAGDGNGYLQALTLHPRRPTVPFDVRQTQNVVALLPGADSRLRDEVVVIGAHYDGQGMDGQANMGRKPVEGAAAASPTVYASANDNAAAVAVLLVMAETMARAPSRPRRSVLFVAFGAEEHGLVGSLHYAAHPVRPWAHHVAMINLEMIGWEAERDVNVRATATSGDWGALLDSATARTGVTTTRSMPALTNDTDHYGFGVRGVPVVHYGVPGSREHYHAVTDTEDRIAYDALGRRAWHALTLTRLVADVSARPRADWRHPADLGLTVTALTPAEYAAATVADSAGALKINAVAEGLPGAAAGLRAGDVLLAVNGRVWGRSQPGARALAEATTAAGAGGAVELLVWRAGERRVVPVSFRRLPD